MLLKVCSYKEYGEYIISLYRESFAIMMFGNNRQKSKVLQKYAEAIE